MPPKKRRKQREVPDEGPETFTQADEVFSDEEDGDEEEEEEDFQASAQDKSDEEEEDEAAGTGPAGTIGRMVVKNVRAPLPHRTVPACGVISPPAPAPAARLPHNPNSPRDPPCDTRIEFGFLTRGSS